MPATGSGVPRVRARAAHPLALATIDAASKAGLALADAAEVSERPGEGLRGTTGARTVQVTSRKKLIVRLPASAELLPPLAGGLECVALIDGRYAATFRYRGEPRAEGKAFIGHLKPHHGFDRVMLVSGDRESEARYLAEKVGITEVYAGQSPEQKLALVREETKKAGTVYMGDGINDSPALTAATIGIAFGQGSDVTAEAAGAVILESSLERVDELLHIGKRMRAIALQTAISGMALSLIAMLVAAAGYLPPVAGAVTQEVSDGRLDTHHLARPTATTSPAATRRSAGAVSVRGVARRGSRTATRPSPARRGSAGAAHRQLPAPGRRRR